jgi:hypothetical protein
MGDRAYAYVEVWMDANLIRTDNPPEVDNASTNQ